MRKLKFLQVLDCKLWWRNSIHKPLTSVTSLMGIPQSSICDVLVILLRSFRCHWHCKRICLQLALKHVLWIWFCRPKSYNYQLHSWTLRHFEKSTRQFVKCSSQYCCKYFQMIWQILKWVVIWGSLPHQVVTNKKWNWWFVLVASFSWSGWGG